MKNNKFKPSSKDIKLFKLVSSILSPDELSCLVNFIKLHNSNDENLDKLFQDEFPEIYEKLLIIGGNNAST